LEVDGGAAITPAVGAQRGHLTKRPQADYIETRAAPPGGRLASRPIIPVSTLQLLELIIIAVVAGVVLYQLYAVLGRRVGRQPEDIVQPVIAPRTGEVDAFTAPVDTSPAPVGVAAIRARDPAFDPGKFLSGARQAYELIVTAFASGDRATLERLLAPEVMTGYGKAIDARESEGRTETVEFTQPPRADLESAEVNGDVARTRVRFLAEFRSRTKGPEGEGVDDRRTAELWTFERRLTNRDPNWTLVRVDAAQA
jgi:predicted lipid-binding transport protein (Tim44 family)